MTALPLSPPSAAPFEHGSPAGSDPDCARARKPANGPLSAYLAPALSRPVETNATATGPSSGLRSSPWRAATSRAMPRKSP